MRKYIKLPSSKVEWIKAPDVKKRVVFIVKSLSMHWVDLKNLYCFRSRNTNTRAYARIWGLGRIWQSALKTDPSYCIEVISEKFDKLNDKQKDEILIHELVHIPKNFSGALLPHFRKGKRKFSFKVNDLIKSYHKAIKL